MSHGKTAVVVGATGLVGKELVKQLLKNEQYAKIKIFARRAIALDSPKLEQNIVDFECLSDWQTAISGDELFCCLGTTIKQAGSELQQTRVDFDYPKLVAQAAVKNGVNKGILVSSSAANKNAKSFYLRLKGQLEAAFIEAGFDQVIIVRPSVLTGQRSEFRLGERVAEVLLYALAWLPLIKKYRPISGQQVAAAMIKLANDKQADKVLIRQLDQLF